MHCNTYVKLINVLCNKIYKHKKEHVSREVKS